MRFPFRTAVYSQQPPGVRTVRAVEPRETPIQELQTVPMETRSSSNLPCKQSRQANLSDTSTVCGRRGCVLEASSAKLLQFFSLHWVKARGANPESEVMSMEEVPGLQMDLLFLEFGGMYSTS